MLWADFMEGSFVSALEHGPEALYPVSMRHITDILADAVADALMVIRKPVISLGVIGIDHGVRRRMIGDKTVQGLRVGMFDHFGAGRLSCPYPLRL